MVWLEIIQYVSTIYVHKYISLTVFLTFLFHRESNDLIFYMTNTIIHNHFIGNLLLNHQHMKLLKHKQDLLYSGRYQDYDYNHRYPWSPQKYRCLPNKKIFMSHNSRGPNLKPWFLVVITLLLMKWAEMKFLGIKMLIFFCFCCCW